MPGTFPISAMLLLAFAFSDIAIAQGPATEPTTQESEAEALAKLKTEREQERSGLPMTHMKSLRDAVQFSIENDDLVVRTNIPPVDMAAILIEGDDGFLTVGVEPKTDANAPYIPGLFRFVRHQFPEPAGIAITHVFVIGPKTQVWRSFEGSGEFQSVDLIQSDEFLEEGEDRVRLYVQARRNEELVDELKLSAVNVAELRRKYPAETMRYLEPIFRELGQSSVLFQVNTRAAWQVLGGSHDPPADVAKRVDDLLKRLDAESPQERTKALAELNQVGQPAALVLMKRDRRALSEEQRTRVETFLAPYTPLSNEEAVKMHGDPEFLLLALSSEDAALSELALRELNRIAKQPITFDPKATGNARTEAVAKLRAQLLPATTRPAPTKPRGESGNAERSPDAR